MLFDLNLLIVDFIQNSFPINPAVRHFPKHALIAEHPNGIIVHGHSVVLSVHHLGGHVPRRATGVLLVLRPVVLRQPKVGDLQVPLFIKQQILRFDIPMLNPIDMQILQSQNYTGSKKLGLLLSEFFLFILVIAEVAPRHVLLD
jgi:hypothetical protein